jgi:hypothetical protein
MGLGLILIIHVIDKPSPVLGGCCFLLTAMATLIQNIFYVFRPFTSTEHTGHEEEPIYFYESDKPYYESVKPSFAIQLPSPLILGCLIIHTSLDLQASPTIQ